MTGPILKGYENLTPEEMRAKEKEIVATRLIETVVNRIQRDENFEYVFPDRSLSPSEVCDILIALGWEQEWYDENGWEQDTWYMFKHPNYPHTLRLFYSGFYWSMALGRYE